MAHDITVYLMKEPESIRSDPKTIAPDFNANDFHWIKEYDNRTIRRKLFIDRHTKNYIDANFDVVVVFGFFAMLSAWSLRKPLVVVSLGPTNLGVVRTEVDAGKSLSVRWVIARHFVRKSVRKAKRILIHYDPEIASLVKIGQLDKARFFGVAESAADVRNMVDDSLLSSLQKRYASYDKIFMWLSRSIYKNENGAEYKGTDKFVRGAADLIKRGAQNVRIIIGDHGFDIDGIKALVQELEIEKHVDYVPHLPMRQLAAYLSLPNGIIFDELTPKMSTSSGLLREALCLGGVVVKSFSKEMTEAAYGKAPPVLYAYTQEDVESVLSMLLSMSSEEFYTLKARSREWAEYYLGTSVAAQSFISGICEVAYLYGETKSASHAPLG
jgi:hypothetical protein